MYQVLYRKWRPKSFADISGQPHITTTLLNELRSGRVSHAYLFTGTRGTGKTTCAKVLAKAVNCLNPKDGEPCNECEICKGIDSGTVLDVVEIDAASNNGVDNIRDLRDASNFTPAVAKYRVYIIDEVHMLSESAFNALLKTLEEPPAYMLFILATTEVHKLPATILSRCQRFDFHRIPVDAIASRIKYVAKQEGLNIEPDAALLLARFADGALRDALSLLDRCASEKNITVETVTNAIGVAGKGHLFEISTALAAKDSQKVLSLIDMLYGNSKDMERLCEELISHYRNLMLAKILKNPSEQIICTPDELQATLNAAHNIKLPDILHAIDVLQLSLERMRTGVSQRIEIEMSLLRLTSPELDTTPEALVSRISELEKQIRLINAENLTVQKTENNVLNQEKLVPSSAPVSQESFNQPADDALSRAEDAADFYRSMSFEEPPVYDEPPLPDDAYFVEEVDLQESEHLTAEQPKTQLKPVAPTQSGALSSVESWPEILNTLTAKNPLLGAMLKGSSAFVKGDILLIDCNNPQFRDLLRTDDQSKNDLREAAAAVLGKKYRLGPYKKQEEQADPLSDFIKSMRQNGINITNTDE